MARQVMKLAADGTVKLIDLDAPGGSLHVLQDGVNGYIERIMLDGFDMYVNEEGKLNELGQVNLVATDLFAEHYGMIDLIMGDVVLTGEVDEEGEIVALPKEIRQRVISKVAFG